MSWDGWDPPDDPHEWDGGEQEEEQSERLHVDYETFCALCRVHLYWVIEPDETKRPRQFAIEEHPDGELEVDNAVDVARYRLHAPHCTPKRSSQKRPKAAGEKMTKKKMSAAVEKANEAFGKLLESSPEKTEEFATDSGDGNQSQELQPESNGATNVETKEIEMSLDVPLTDAEIIALADEAVGAQRRLDAEKWDFDRIKEAHKERTGGLTTEIADALLKIERRKTSKRVKCIEVRDYSAKTVRILNGEEVVAERTMTPAEVQAELDARQLKMFPAADEDENGISKQVIDESHLDEPEATEAQL